VFQSDGRQMAARQAIEGCRVMEILADYEPILAGTIPLGIETPQSDLDIICEVHDFTQFRAIVTASFSTFEGFSLRTRNKDGIPAEICGFFFEGFYFELFAQPIPARNSPAVRHMMVEARLLAYGGPEAIQAIRDLKLSGMKTEPAFAHHFGIVGDPYAQLLEMSDLDDQALAARITRTWAP